MFLAIIFPKLYRIKPTTTDKKRNRKNKSIFAQWKPVPSQEQKVFCVAIIHLYVLYKPSMHDYWSKRPVMQTNYEASVGMSLFSLYCTSMTHNT
jgi:hypothetical protein